MSEQDPMALKEEARLRDEDALRRCLNDADFLLSLRLEFAEKMAAGQLDNLKQAARAGDMDTMRHQAHTLKGALDLIGADKARQMARKLESWPPTAGDAERCAAADAFGEEIQALIALIREQKR